MKHLLFALLIFTLIPCRADDVVIHLGSYHTAYRSELESYDALNELNPGIGWQNHNFGFGVYKNSLSRGAIYASRKINFDNFFLFAGLITVHRRQYPVSPFIGVGANFGKFQFAAFPNVSNFPDYPEKDRKLFFILSASLIVNIN